MSDVIAAAARWYVLRRRSDSTALEDEHHTNVARTLAAVQWLLSDLDGWASLWSDVRLSGVRVESWADIVTVDGRPTAARQELDLAALSLANAAAHAERTWMQHPDSWARPAWSVTDKAAQMWATGPWEPGIVAARVWQYPLSCAYRAALAGAALHDLELARAQYELSCRAFVGLAERMMGAEPVSERRTA